MTPFSTRPEPDAVGPGQESAWDYPRPPRLEPTSHRLRVVLGGDVIAETTSGLRVLETSHPPNYYLPRRDIVDGALDRSDASSFCEFKGTRTTTPCAAQPVTGSYAMRPGATTNHQRHSPTLPTMWPSTPTGWTPATSMTSS